MGGESEQMCDGRLDFPYGFVVFQFGRWVLHAVRMFWLCSSYLFNCFSYGDLGSSTVFQRFSLAFRTERPRLRTPYGTMPCIITPNCSSRLRLWTGMIWEGFTLCFVVFQCSYWKLLGFSIVFTTFYASDLFSHICLDLPIAFLRFVFPFRSGRPRLRIQYHTTPYVVGRVAVRAEDWAPISIYTYVYVCVYMNI